MSQSIKTIYPLLLVLAAGSTPALTQPIVDSNAKVTPFAPGIVSTSNDEGAASFTPDGTTVYFTMGGVSSTICYSKEINGRWGTPAVASFSGRWNDMDAFVSPDGRRIFFSSDRPLPGTPADKANKHHDLWVVEDTGGGNWGEPHHLEGGINTGIGNDYAPSVGSDGTLYWCSRNREGNKGMQTYFSTWLGDQYDRPKLLSIPGASEVQDPFIAANGKYLVFLNGQDLFVSLRGPEDWLPATKIGPPVSIGDYLNSPYVSRDGKTLYFTSGRRKGFYKRNPRSPALSYADLVKENDNTFNGNGNILTVSVNLPDGSPATATGSSSVVGSVGLSLVSPSGPVDPATSSPSPVSPHAGQSLVDSNAMAAPFAPGIVDTRNDEEACSFSLDGKTIYFAMGSVYSTICCSRNIHGQWQKPEVASFSGRWTEMDPFVSPDGHRLYFSSARPLPGAAPDTPNRHYELWYVADDGHGSWGEAHHVDAPFNTAVENNVAPSVSRKGTLYFSSWDRDADKGMQSYYAIWLGDHYDQPKLLTMTGIGQIEDPYISPNEKYLLFSDGNDLYFCTRNSTDWSTPQKVGPPVSKGDGINSPYVSHDGKTLYFTSGRMDGFYQRDPVHHALDFGELMKENNNVFNGRGNIFSVPVHLPADN